MRETTSTVSKMDFECDCQSDRNFQACERFLSNLSLGSSQTDNEDEDKLIPNDILYKAYLSLKIIGEGKDFFKMILVEDNNQTFNCLIHDIASMVSNGEEMFVEQSDGSAVLVEKLQNIVTSFIWNHCKVLMRTDVFIESIQIDKYRNIFSDREILGEGGYGIVYKARHKIDKKIYALKQISENKYTYDSFCLINREVHSLTDLREHVNIVRIYKSWWELDKQSLSLYIQMELCDTDLRILLDERYCNILTQTKNPALSIDLNKSKGWLRQLVEGINYIHTKGFIHRDLKPQNIFYVNNQEKIKIGDFGLSRVNCNYSKFLGSTIGGYGSTFDTQSDNELSQGVGTSIYDAPEQRKTTKYGRKVDMYSLGVIVFELFYPFGTQSELVTAINDVKENAGPITKINEFWADIIVNLLSEEPTCRYNSRELRTKLLKTVAA